YFTLGKRGAKIVGLARSKIGPLGPQALYREYGTLAYCCLGEIQRERMRMSEIMRHHPEYILGRLDASHYYLDMHESTVRLGYIWTEGGGDTTHIVQTVKKDIIEARRDIPALRQMIDDQKFVVAIITLNEDKKEAILRTVRTIPTTVFFRVT